MSRSIRLLPLCFLLISACAIMATRPLQEMSDTAAALKAAKEVQADRFAPELYRQAREFWFKARQEYKFKDYKEAKDSARKARQYAEKAEFESLANGGKREALPEDPFAKKAGDGAQTPDDNFEAPRNDKFVEAAEEEAANAKAKAAAPTTPTTPTVPTIQPLPPVSR